MRLMGVERIKINMLLSCIDKMIDKQLKAILQKRNYLTLLASWVGLHYLVTTAGGVKSIKIKVLNSSWERVRVDLTRPSNVEQSKLFHMIHNDGFGIAGGEPYGLLLFDHVIDFNPVSNGNALKDIDLLKKITLIAAKSFCPLILGLNASCLGFDTFMHKGFQLNHHWAIENHYKRIMYQFQQKEEARYLGFIAPKMLFNTYYQKIVKTESIYCTHERLIWCNAIYGYASVFVKSFKRTHWFLECLGMRKGDDTASGGVVDDLLPMAFKTLNSEAFSARLLTETRFSQTEEKNLNDLGISVFNHIPFLERAVLFSSPMFKKEEQDLTTQLYYLLCVCRFAHFLKILGRNMIGRFHHVKECERYLQTWLNNYIASNTNITAAMKSRFPLSGGKIQILLQKGVRESYMCIMHLKPQVRASHLNAGLILKTNVMNVN